MRVTLFLMLALTSAWGAMAQTAMPQPQLGQALSLTEEEVRNNTRTFAPQFSPGTFGAIDGLSVDTQNRTDVLVFYHQVYLASEGYENRIAWTGDMGTCNEGTIASVFLDDTRRRINYFRAMAGLPANIQFDATKNAKSQKAALIMSANNNLSHFPNTDFPGGSCLSADGHEAAGKANIALGSFGAGSVDRYIEDAGANNAVVGHRRWLLHPPAVEMGSGSVPGIEGSNTVRPANAIWVIGDFAPTRPVTPEFISWPPPGYVPFNLAYPRWSLSFPDADFSSATVTMTAGGTNVTLFVEARVSNTTGPDSTIIWQPNGFPAAAPAADVTYSVTVANVIINGSPRTFTYDVILMDPNALNDPITVTGSATPSVGVDNTYSFNAVSQATQYQLRSAEVTSAAWVEGAEDAPAPMIIDGTTGGYSITSSVLSRTGGKSFHMAFASFDDNDQTVTVSRDIVPSASSVLEFYSRFRFATTTSRVIGEVSTDGGSSWATLSTRAGNGSTSSGGWESAWTLSSSSLAAYAGQTVRVRVRYAFDPFTSIFTGTSDSVGVFVDDITVTQAEELVNQNIATIAGGETTATFNPGSASQFYLQMQSEVAGKFFGFGAPLIVNAQVAPPSINIDTVSILSGTTVQIDFTLMNGTAGTFQLLKATNPGTALSTDRAAAFQTIMANSKYRVTTPTGGTQGYYVIRMD